MHGSQPPYVLPPLPPPLQVLDIGGGFAGGRFGPEGSLVGLGGVPAAVNAALDVHFPPTTGVRIIAEPGRFFAEGIATMGCMVFGRRPRVQAGQTFGLRHTAGFDYWVTDGIYGSMNSLLYDHATLTACPLLVAGTPPEAAASAGAQLLPSTVFGPSCDGLDTLLQDTPLPEMQVRDGAGPVLSSSLAACLPACLPASPCGLLPADVSDAPRASALLPARSSSWPPHTLSLPLSHPTQPLILPRVPPSHPSLSPQVGDWLAFPGMGAYTICGASRFNGIDALDVPTFYVCSAGP